MGSTACPESLETCGYNFRVKKLTVPCPIPQNTARTKEIPEKRTSLCHDEQTNTNVAHTMATLWNNPITRYSYSTIKIKLT